MALIKASRRVEGKAYRARAEALAVAIEVAEDLDDRPVRGPRTVGYVAPVGHFERIAEDADRCPECGELFGCYCGDSDSAFEPFCYCSRRNPVASDCDICFALWA